MKDQPGAAQRSTRDRSTRHRQALGSRESAKVHAAFGSAITLGVGPLLLSLLTPLLTLILLAATPHLTYAAGDPTEAGAYCPFPAKGETPACFAPVERKYSAFFAAVDAGEVDDDHVAALEQELANNDSEEDGYLAISSLAYGYYRLAERAATSEASDPALVARLNGLNVLLSKVYADADARPEFRSALRAAAEDLHARAPAVSTGCEAGSNGQDCQTTGVLLRALRTIDDPRANRGVRGALGRLIERFSGRTDDVARPAGSRER